MELTVSTLEELDGVADALTRLVEEGYSVFLFSGTLGSGKTTLIQVLCRRWKVTQPVNSPTFSLVNEYQSPLVGVIYHMDLYRLDKPEDLVQIGLEEYLDSGHLCLIEWPALAEDYFIMPHVRIKIQVENNHIRTFMISTHDAVDA